MKIMFVFSDSCHEAGPHGQIAHSVPNAEGKKCDFRPGMFSSNSAAELLRHQKVGRQSVSFNQGVLGLISVFILIINTSCPLPNACLLFPSSLLSGRGGT